MNNEHPKLTTAMGDSVVLKSVHAEGRLEGLLLTMTLRQVFVNDGPDNLEVSYTFPLAFGAVLTGLHVTLGGKRMAGRVMARRDARARYEEAVEQGDAPVMVEKGQNGVFSAMLGSLQPGEEALIELQYAQLLAFEQGRIRLVIPTTIAPRYGDAVAQGGLQIDQVAQPSLLAEHRFGLKLTLAGELAQASLSSPTHDIATRTEVDGVSLALPKAAWLDRDFVLLIEGLQGRSFALLGPDAHSGEGHVALIASCCPALSEAQSLPLRLKILVDCSGSMAGDSMAQAKAALQCLVRTLAPTDHVSLSRFGNSPQRVLGAAAANAAHLKALGLAIDQTDANLGGTEILEALEDTFALSMQGAGSTAEADILLITDGEVWDAKAIVKLAAHQGHRIYALGVGSAPAESLLREMAEASAGACEFVTPAENMAQAVDRLVQRIRRTQAVQIELQTEAPLLWRSPLPQRLVSGDTVHVHARLGHMPEEGPTLWVNRMLGTKAPLLQRSDDLVARLVAARQTEAEQNPEVAQQWAEQYQLVTEHTNLLLVIERAEGEKTDGMPALHQVSPMLAAGWGGSSGHGHARQSQVMYRTVPDQSAMGVSAVWRSNRTQSASKVDAMSSAGMDDFEIPLFLRKETEPISALEHSPAKQLLSNVRDKLFGRGQPDRLRATPKTIITTFNEAAALGQGFRQTVRVVSAIPHETVIFKMIVKVARQLGGPLKAWACYLKWLHDKAEASPKLSGPALALVDEQLRGTAAQDMEWAFDAFEAAGLTAASAEP